MVSMQVRKGVSHWLGNVFIYMCVYCCKIVHLDAFNFLTNETDRYTSIFASSAGIIPKMTTKDISTSAIHFCQDVLWPVALLPSSESGAEDGAVGNDVTTLTVIDLGDHFVALNNNTLHAANSNDIYIMPCNVYKGSTCDFYMQANFGYRLMWEVDLELFVIPLHPKDLAAIIIFRCGTALSDYSLKGEISLPSVPNNLEEPARRGIVPNPKGVKVSPRHEAFEALAKALQTDATMYLSTAGNLYLPITNLLREHLVTNATELIHPTALFTYSDYQLTDLSNKEEVDDVDWLTGSYVEVVREELSRDKQLAEHLVNIVLHGCCSFLS